MKYCAKLGSTCLLLAAGLGLAGGGNMGNSMGGGSGGADSRWPR